MSSFSVSSSSVFNQKVCSSTVKGALWSFQCETVGGTHYRITHARVFSQDDHSAARDVKLHRELGSCKNLVVR